MHISFLWGVFPDTIKLPLDREDDAPKKLPKPNVLAISPIVHFCRTLGGWRTAAARIQTLCISTFSTAQTSQLSRYLSKLKNVFVQIVEYIRSEWICPTWCIEPFSQLFSFSQTILLIWRPFFRWEKFSEYFQWINLFCGGFLSVGEKCHNITSLAGKMAFHL